MFSRRALGRPRSADNNLASYRTSYFFRMFTFLAVFACLAAISRPGYTAEPIIIALDADMSSSSAQAGLAIQRGAELAIDEINAAGGLLGHQVELLINDHRGNPSRGIDNVVMLADRPNVLAVLGGLHTPVALQQLESIHEHKLIYLGAWAAGTPVVDNKYEPNYVFRISVRDQFAGGYLVDKAFEAGHMRIGMLFERTGWGRSNERAVNEALSARGHEAVGIEWFNWGVTDLSQHVERLKIAGADVIVLVANPPEGLRAVEAMAAREKADRIPILSHWGITGGTFPQMAGDSLHDVNLTFLQTFSFVDPPIPDRANVVFESYSAKFPDVTAPEDVPSAPGTAHAYDLIRLLALAVKDTQSLNREHVRDALERIPFFAGLVRDYDPPFSAEKHDALTADDFTLAKYGENGEVVPVDSMTQ